MTGEEVGRIRLALGMSLPQFSQLLGVHPTTAYRWEGSGPHVVRLDPLHAGLLTHLSRQLAARSSAARTDWAKQIVEGVVVGGTLVGLAVLLNELLPSQPPRRRTARARRRR
jgi:hypothetical protein